MNSHTLTLTDYWLELDGVPRFLFGGDFTYPRARRSDWRDGLLRMKAAGMNWVTCYVPWLIHEPEPGVFDYTGNRDLGAFLDLVRELGFYAAVRLGPFVHGEYRNGGLPQWLIDRLGSRVRTNDPEYLEYAARHYRKMIEIIRPRLYTSGGAVILMQLENELGAAGCKGDDIPRGSATPEENARHVRFYYDLVREGGLRLPVIDINRLPPEARQMEQYCDTAGGYPVNCFAADGELPPFSTANYDRHTRPRLSIETGTGMFARMFDYPPYRHTNGYQGPLLPAAVCEALVQQQAAEGCNGIGMFVLFDGTLADQTNESMLGRGPMNYQAPIGGEGQLRDSYRAIKRFGWFIRAFERELLRARPSREWARCVSYGTPHPGVEDGLPPGDLFEGYGREQELPTHLRQIREVESLARVTPGLNLSESNFLFLRNVHNRTRRWLRDIRVTTGQSRLGSEVFQEYPKRVQLELPPDCCKILPFFVRLEPGCYLEYATATLLDRRPFGDQLQVILHASTEETVEWRTVVRDGALGSSPDLLVIPESPCSVTLLGVPSARIQVGTINRKLRYVLVSSELAGEVWEFGSRVAFSNLQLLDSDDHQLTAVADQQEYYLEILTPRPGRPRFDCDWHYDAERGLLRLTGTVELPEPVLDFRRRQEGDALILEAELEPEALLRGLDNLILEVELDGTHGVAAWNGRIVSEHLFGRFRPWELGLRELGSAPGTLKLSCRDARAPRIRLRPRRRLTLDFDWE